MSDSTFYDTNILVYAYDESEKEKRQIAEKLVEGVFKGESSGVLSNQIISEFFYVLTKKIKRPLTKEVAAKIIRKYVLSEKWDKINYTSSTSLKAAISASYYNSPFWDALVVETMKENGVNRIITENDKDISKMPGIKVINPFKH